MTGSMNRFFLKKTILFLKQHRMITFILNGTILFFIYALFLRNSGETLYDVLGDKPYQGTTIFLETVIQYEPVSYIIEKMPVEKSDAIRNQQLFYYNLGKKSWVVDKKIDRAYSFIPPVDFDTMPWVIRIKPDIKLNSDISSCSGKYMCTGYINKEWEIIGLKKIVTFTITSLRKKSFFNVRTRKLPLPAIHSSEEEKEFWKAFVEVTYQRQKLPDHEPDKMLINSVPAGLKVFLISFDNLAESYKEGEIDVGKLKRNVLTHERLQCVSPAYITYPKESCYVFFEFISPYTNVIDDECALEASEVRSDGKVTLWRGYPIEMTNGLPSNTVVTALFLLRGLDASEILQLIEPSPYFPLDISLFDIFISPVLMQVKQDGADQSLTASECTRIMEAIGKLTIDTYTGTYIFTTVKKPDGGVSLHTNKRCTEFLLNNKQVIQRLPQFFYRQ